METIKNLFTPRASAPANELAATAPSGGPRTLQSRYKAQTARLRDTQRAQRPKNTQKAYGPKQKEWTDWCTRLDGNTDGAWVTEDKLCLFLEQEVINRESRASGYEARKAKRREIWEDGERKKKKRKTNVSGTKEEEHEGAEGEDMNEEALDGLFTETVRFSVVSTYVSAVTELYAWQAEGDKASPPLRGAKLSALLENVRRDENRIQRVNFTDRGLFTITGGYDVKGLKKAISWCWETACKPPGSVESCLRTAAEHLLGHATVTRGESRREAQLADLVLIDLENEGPKPNESAPCLIMTMRQGKQNQHGKVEYMGCIRNVDPVLCPLSALAFYFFNRWGKDGALGGFPSFRQPEDYYSLFVFPGTVKTPTRPLSYHTQFEWSKKMFQGVGIHSKETTHSARKQSARLAELDGVPETQIRRAGRWNTDKMTGAYLSYLPRAFIRSIAGFPKEGKGYFLPRARETPPEALCSKIWPEADAWLQRMEAYRPNRAENEVVRLDLAGSGFLRLLRVLRVVLLQDSVVLRRAFPRHPLWKDSLFSCQEYQRFAARVEDALAHVVTPDELIMQQYWPAHEAVAKLRHEAAISEIRSVQSDVRSMLERLDETERSSAASYAPIWIQQGKTGIWIGPTEAAGHLGAATGAPVPQPGTPEPALPQGQGQGQGQGQALPHAAPLGPIILDPQAPPRGYKMLRGSNSVFQLWTEWTLGLAGGPSIEALDRCWGARWRIGSEAMFYSRRRKIINEIRRRVEEGTARDDRQAIDQLEQLRGKRSLDWLCKTV